MCSLQKVAVAFAMVAVLTGCDSKPAGSALNKPPSAAAKPTGSQPSEADLAAVKTFIDDKTTGTPTGAASAGGAMPPGHPPTSASGAGARTTDTPAGHPPVGGAAAEVKFEAPADWTKQQPRSSMRKAQYGLPRVEGDSEDGELVVFYFGKGEGGPVRDNIERWKGQFKTADGKPLPGDASKEEKFEASGLPVSWLDVSGRYDPGQMPGVPATGPRDNFRMFAAVIETPGGTWFVKATGPAATMAKREESIRTYVKSARVEK
ncbi:MAG: hypothetical protein ACKVS9_02905 [Phycisphaerae bacterium]